MTQELIDKLKRQNKAINDLKRAGAVLFGRSYNLQTVQLRFNGKLLTYPDHMVAVKELL